MLALEDAGDARREAAERLVRRVDDVPASLDLARREARTSSSRHRSSFVSVRARRSSPEDDPPQAEALRRGDRPVEGRSPRRRAPPATAASSISPRPTSRRTATIRRTIPRRKASAATSIVTSDPARRTRTAVHGPDRLVRSAAPKAGSRAGPRGPTRLAPSRRRRAGPAPRARDARGAGCAARSRRCSGTPGTAPRSGGGTRPAPVGGRGSRRPPGASASSARPSSSAASRPGVGEGDHLAGGVHPGVGPAGPVDPDPLPPVRRASAASSSPWTVRAPGWSLEAGEVRPVIFDPGAVAHGRRPLGAPVVGRRALRRSGRSV